VAAEAALERGAIARDREGAVEHARRTKCVIACHRCRIVSAL
jgi:hypothetical protein